MNIKTILSIIIFVFFSFTYTSFSYADDKDSVIAAILPLTGDAASAGEASKNALELSYQSLPENVKSKYKLVFEDDALEPSKTISAFNRLNARYNVTALVVLSSGTAKAVSPLAENRHIPMIAIATDPRICSNKKFVFNHWVTPEEEAKVMLEEIGKRGYKKIAIISTQQDGALFLRNAFTKMNSGQFEVVLNDDFAPNNKDFRGYLAKLRSKEPIDGVLAILFQGQLSTFAKNLKELQIKSQLFGFEIFEDSSEVAAAEGALNNAWYVNASDGENSFVKKYRVKFPNATLFGASNAYDSLTLIGNALNDNVPIERYLASIKDFKGASGVYSSTKDNRFTLKASVKIITEKGFETLRN